jgi:hypothetical protein
MTMNIKSKIKFYIHKGFSEVDATKMAIEDAQRTIDDMNKKLRKALDYLTVDQVKEIYGDISNES